MIGLNKETLFIWLTILVLCLLQFTAAAPNQVPKKTTVPDLNRAPIIGVLAQELYEDSLVARHFPNKTAYIAASYVKFLEGGGARVVPIWIGRNQSYYENLMQQINGVLLPGGATWFNQTAGYGDAGEILINIAIRMNDNGTFMPVWGTCLGMELLVYKMSNGTESRVDCSSKAQPLPLEFKPNYNESRLFGNASEEIISVLAKENVTLNSHRFCYTEKVFGALQLNNSWRVLSLNHDWDGLEFISTVEHTRYPFYGVQFHPEKPLYEYNAKGAIPHTSGAIKSNQYFAHFIVNEARRNNHTFANATEEAYSLMYAYKPEHTAVIGSGYVQQYLFTNADMGLFELDPIIDEDPDEGGGTIYYPYPYPYNNNGGAAEVIFNSLYSKIFILLALQLSALLWA